MSLTKGRIIEDFIWPALQEVLPPGAIPPGEPAEIVLLGKGAALDSLGLVSTILAIEGRIRDELDVSLTLASEAAFSRSASPFRTVASLAEYILELTRDTQRQAQP
jgi:acyl carrier protein